jgi:bifunctional DNase/RNase
MNAVTLRGIATTEAGFVVLLDCAAQKLTVPIAIGSSEAQAILIELKGMEFPRPLTHDLLRNVLTELGATLAKVEVTELRDDTFFAVLHLDGPGGRVTVDARPSDAMALALRCRAPILVADDVLAKAGIGLDQDGSPAAAATASPADPVSDLKAQLEQAIAAERYEEAARLRDQLREL